MSKELEFVEDEGKHYKIETYTQEVDLTEVPKQIAWLEGEIVMENNKLAQLQADLDKLKKLDLEKIPKKSLKKTDVETIPEESTN